MTSPQFARTDGNARGFAKPRLERMHDVLAGHVERGWAPGLVSVVSRHDEVHVETIGAKALGGEPMRQDTIFRIASLSKPVTAVAAMILVEECVLRLDEPVDSLLPELADRQVLTRPDAPLDDTVPAERPITVRDLLTFRMGFGGIFQTDSPIDLAARAKSLTPLSRLESSTPDEYMSALGSVPLMFQPGEKWLYHTGSDVLGVLIERACGQPLEAFLRERIFSPLGMVDTGFSLSAEKLDRLATAYNADPATGELTVTDDPADSEWSSPPGFPSAGGGLLSTVDDLHAFGQMMLHRGDGILSRPAVELMTADHLTPGQKAVSGFFPGYFDNRGWGFGVAVDTVRVGLPSVGRFGWDGGSGTSWWSDPVEGLTGILLTQRSAFPLASPLYLDFWTSAYQAIH
jgi:CubicO group peptidase (beta-lactamase class C family)